MLHMRNNTCNNTNSKKLGSGCVHRLSLWLEKEAFDFQLNRSRSPKCHMIRINSVIKASRKSQRKESRRLQKVESTLLPHRESSPSNNNFGANNNFRVVPCNCTVALRSDFAAKINLRELNFTSVVGKTPKLTCTQGPEGGHTF